MSENMIPLMARSDVRIAGDEEGAATDLSRRRAVRVRAPLVYRDYARTLPNVPVLAPITVIESAADVTHPQFRRLFDLWDGLRAGRTFPSRQDFALSSLAFLLGNLMLVDVVANPARLRFRLVGTDIVNRLGSDPTGQWFEQPLAGSYLAPANSVLTHHAPCMALRDMAAGKQPCRFELLVAPLADDGLAINMLIAALVPARAPLAAAAVGARAI